MYVVAIFKRVQKRNCSQSLQNVKAGRGEGVMCVCSIHYTTKYYFLVKLAVSPCSRFRLLTHFFAMRVRSHDDRQSFLVLTIEH